MDTYPYFKVSVWTVYVGSLQVLLPFFFEWMNLLAQTKYREYNNYNRKRLSPFEIDLFHGLIILYK